MKIEIFENGFDPYQWLRSYQKANSELQHNVGATSIFIGTMRDFNEGSDVKAMFLEHYPGMTEKNLQEIAQDAINKWDILDIAIAHRVGDIFPGDPIVCVVVWSVHRKEAYEANRMVMEVLKSNAPFWKKEQLGESSRWVEKNTKGF